MAISLKAGGAWASSSLNNQNASLPGTPSAGDRYYVWVAWKGYTLTLTAPAGWTQITSYADGTVVSSNGGGSVRVTCLYRDWQVGDPSSITLTLNSGPTIMGWCAQLWQKGADESWLAPAQFNAPWPSQASGTISATAAGSIPDGAVVHNLLGFPENSATLTRPTTGVDVSGGITWSGNTVEAPPTHLATTAGQNMSADLNHRFVTTGNAGSVTLQSTVTSLSLAMTGASLWLVQGVTAGGGGDGGMFLVM